MKTLTVSEDAASATAEQSHGVVADRGSSGRALKPLGSDSLEGTESARIAQPITS